LQNEICKKINDSKKLTKIQRWKIFSIIKSLSGNDVKFGVGIIENTIIDKINILSATKLSMLSAYKNLLKKYGIFPEIIIVDGNFLPFKKQDKISKIIPIIKGDQKSLSIALASIIAKETRDEIMREMHKIYPNYDFDKHVGYPTKSHIERIKKYGICDTHRKTFAPIKSMF
jgi:ribonuclease HII